MLASVKKVTIKNKTLPWLTNTLKCIIRLKDKACKQFETLLEQRTFRIITTNN